MPVGIINVNVRCCIYEKQEAGLEFSMVISKTWDCGTGHMINFKGFLIRLEFVNYYGKVHISIPTVLDANIMQKGRERECLRS